MNFLCKRMSLFKGNCVNVVADTEQFNRTQNSEKQDGQKEIVPDARWCKATYK